MPRALWKGAISFGLVTIPVSLYAARNAREDLTFHMLHKTDLSRIHNKRVDEEDHEVALDDIVKGYEFDEGRYVVIGESDLEAASVEATQTIDIVHFVPSDEIDIAYYDSPYYTEPAKVGRKAYALLREALKRSNKVGVAKIVIRERQHLCALVADGQILLACTLRWPYQLRDISELDLPGEKLDTIGVSPQELKMAEQLVEAMSASWDPAVYRDTYRDSLLELIDKRVKSGELTKVSERPKPAHEEGNVVDIMSLLKKSVEARKSGSPSADEAKPPAGGKRPRQRTTKAG